MFYLYIFFISFFLLVFLFLMAFSLTDTNDSQDSKLERENHYLVFLFHSITNIHLVHRDFYHFFLIDLFVITRLLGDETCSPWIFTFTSIFISAIKSELLPLTFQSDIVRI